MRGAWRYNSGVVVDGPSLNTGLHVTLTVDAIAGSRFSGRVTQWFAGDVGIRPEVFGPFTGSVDDLAEVTLVLPSAGAGLPALTITGALSGDALTVRESWLGTDPGPFLNGELFRRTP